MSLLSTYLIVARRPACLRCPHRPLVLDDVVEYLVKENRPWMSRSSNRRWISQEDTLEMNSIQSLGSASSVSSPCKRSAAEFRGMLWDCPSPPICENVHSIFHSFGLYQQIDYLNFRRTTRVETRFLLQLQASSGRLEIGRTYHCHHGSRSTSMEPTY